MLCCITKLNTDKCQTDGGFMSEGWIGFRIDTEIKKEILELVGAGKEYRDISAFVNAAIYEKLDPLKRDETFKKKLLKMLDDPEIREYLVKK